MSSNPRSSSSPAAGQPLPPLRGDLEVSARQGHDGPEYVLKDPLANQYFRLGAEEWFIARLLDGCRSLDDVHRRAATQFPEHNLPPEEIAAFVRRLAVAGMLRLPGRVDLDRLLAARQTSLVTQLVSLAGRLFYIRLPGVNPDRFISWLTPRAAFVGRLPFAVFAGLTVIAALVLLAWQGHRLGEPQAEFLSPVGLAYLMLALVGLKVVHELAHACVCKHFGGRVTEMGLIFIVFTPCLYCDVSDAWMFPSRSRRIAVTAAGIVSELFIAALAAIVFFVSRPGAIHQAAFSLMTVASISTILFNANPLLRYDGYYLLSDLLNVPNLRIRSRRWAAALVRRLFLATPIADFDRPGRHRLLLLVYAVASYLYGWFILYAILGLVYRKLEPYGLQPLAVVLILVSLAVQIGLPAWLMLRSLARFARETRRPARFVRPAVALGLTAALVVVLVRLPIRDTLTQSCVVEPAQPTDVRSPAAGFIIAVRVRSGEPVARGDTLFVIRNDELVLARDRAAADLQEVDLLVDRARAAGDPAQVRQLDIQRRQVRGILDETQRRVDALTVMAPAAGFVLSDLTGDRVGTYVTRGDLLVRLAEPGQVKVAMDLVEHDAQRIAVGAPADLCVRSDANRTFRGLVATNARTASASTPAVLTTLIEGDVPVTRSGGAVHSTQRVYRTELDIFDPDDVLRPGMSGRARISLGRTTVGGWLWRQTHSQLSLDVLLNVPRG